MNLTFQSERELQMESTQRILSWGHCLVAVAVQSLSCVWLFAARQASLSFAISWSLFRFMSIESVTLSNRLILCLLLLFPPSVFPSIRIFFIEVALHIMWLKYWSFSFNISPSNEYSGLISFRMDWLDILAVQQAHKCLLQHHISKALILQLIRGSQECQSLEEVMQWWKHNLSNVARSRGGLWPLEAGRRQEKFSPGASRRNQLCRHLDVSPWDWFWTSDFKNYKKINMYCFKPPSVCLFLMATIENYCAHHLW